MNGLEILIGFGGVALGFLIGMIVELAIDAQTIKELQDANRTLKLKLKDAERQPEIIEITDPWSISSKVPEEVTFPNTDGF